jgi:hypothetical protein
MVSRNSSISRGYCPHCLIIGAPAKIAGCKVLASEVSNGEDGEWGRIRAYRQVQYDRLRTQLREAQKNASLKSGARGSQSRKELLTMEKRVEDAGERYLKMMQNLSLSSQRDADQCSKRKDR